MKMRRTGLLLAAILIITLACTGCGTGLTRSEKTGSDWSRGVQLGLTGALDPVQIALTSDDTPLLAWVEIGDGSRQIRIQTLSREGTPLQHWTVATDNAPSQLRLLPATNDRFHLVWVSGGRDLLHALVSSTGDIISEHAIATATLDINYDIVRLTDGSAVLIWSSGDESQQELQYTLVASDGDPIMGPTNMDLPGFDIATAQADDGTIQMAWLNQPEPARNDVFYGVFDPSTGMVEQSCIIASFSTTTGVVARRPAIALDDENSYVFWTRERRGGGLTPPRADTYYAWFPIGEPTAAVTDQIALPTTREPAYTMDEPTLGLSLAPIDSGIRGSQFCYFPGTLQIQQDPTMIAFAIQQVGRTTEIIQIVTTVWQDGAPVSYQVAARTTAASQKPALARDSQGDWHLTWLDVGPSGTHRVYYASTSDQAVSYLNKVRLEDIAKGIADILWGLIQSLAFLPMAVVWFFPGLVIISVFFLITADGNLEFNGPRIALGVSGLAYIITKYLFRPSWLLDLPLPAFVGPALGDKIVLLAPLIMAILAGVLTMWYIKKKPSASALAGYAIFVLADAILTMLLYVPGIFAE